MDKNKEVFDKENWISSLNFSYFLKYQQGQMYKLE